MKHLGQEAVVLHKIQDEYSPRLARSPPKTCSPTSFEKCHCASTQPDQKDGPQLDNSYKHKMQSVSMWSWYLSKHNCFLPVIRPLSCLAATCSPAVGQNLERRLTGNCSLDRPSCLELQHRTPELCRQKGWSENLKVCLSPTLALANLCIKIVQNLYVNANLA